jgi:hypothetical protein
MQKLFFIGSKTMLNWKLMNRSFNVQLSSKPLTWAQSGQHTARVDIVEIVTAGTSASAGAIVPSPR